MLSQSSGGEMFFWDYPKSKIVKKIQEKKERIISYCYVDELQMMYMGTEDAKIISSDLSILYNNKVSKDMDVTSLPK